jgi:hypothetical protein
MTHATLLDARVEYGPAALEIPAPLIDGTLEGGGFRMVADRAQAYFEIESVADFAISEGSRVRVNPHPGAHPTEVDAYLRGTVAAMLLGQRGRFALHATLVRVEGTVVAVAAAPGVGKSTSALRLEQLGHELVGDDFAELRPEEEGIAYITLGRAVHVAPEAAAALGIDTAGAPKVSRHGEKLALPARPVTSGRLEAVAVLSHDDGERVATRRLPAERALANVFTHTFRVGMVKQLWPTEAFAWAAAVAAQLPVFAVTRPHEGWTVDAVAQAVEAIAADTRAADASRL